MRLYLTGDSEQNITYIPDWIKASYRREGKTFDLIFDIQAHIEYSKGGLCATCKGDLVPWVLVDRNTGTETDLSRLGLVEIEKICQPEKAVKWFDIVVGVCPVYDDDIEAADADTLTNCIGKLCLNDGSEFDFEFFPEPTF